jgi:hypothetical protein
MPQRSRSTRPGSTSRDLLRGERVVPGRQPARPVRRGGAGAGHRGAGRTAGHPARRRPHRGAGPAPRAVQLRGRVLPAVGDRRTSALATGSVRRTRHGGRALRPRRLRGRQHDLPGHLHGVRRRPHRAPADRDVRLPPVPGVAARRAGREDQGGWPCSPRRVGGRHVALSRWDRENNAIATSADGLWWGDARTMHVPTRPWELTQTGNCGSPVETDQGWLVLTHGVRPMREYAIVALLLDLESPSRVIGALREPLISPRDDERDGYGPTSCTPAGHSCMASGSCCPTGPATPPCGSPSSTCRSSSSG